MTKSNTTNELPQMCQKLPKGIRAKIAKKFGVSENYVTDVKNNRRNNLDILEAIIDEIEAHHKREAEIRKRASKI
jgi:hypothetical protein